MNNKEYYKKKSFKHFFVFFYAFVVFLLVLCSDRNGTVGATEADSIAILYENDVHCVLDGYFKLAAMKAELKGGCDHVGVVSSGDFVQGGTIGTV